MQIEVNTMRTREQRVERLAYRYAEAAQAMGCCTEHIANLVKRGQLRSVELGRCRVVPKDELQKLLAHKARQQS
jgi:excisionase family DNA binding protein